MSSVSASNAKSHRKQLKEYENIVAIRDSKQNRPEFFYKFYVDFPHQTVAKINARVQRFFSFLFILFLLKLKTIYSFVPIFLFYFNTILSFQNKVQNKWKIPQVKNTNRRSLFV